MKKTLEFLIILFVSVTILSGCGKDTTTTKCYITGVTVNKLPLTDENGENWDNELQGTYPDVYFKIISTDDGQLMYGMKTFDRKENTNGFPIKWNFSGDGITIDIDKEFYLAFYDYDSMNDDDFMGKCGDHKLVDFKYKTEVDIVCDEISYTLYLRWSY